MISLAAIVKRKEIFAEPKRTHDFRFNAEFFMNLAQDRIVCRFVQMHPAAGKIIMGRGSISHSKKLTLVNDDRAYSVIEASLGRFERHIHRHHLLTPRKTIVSDI